jgi:hypothetical protein
MDDPNATQTSNMSERDVYEYLNFMMKETKTNEAVAIRMV